MFLASGLWGMGKVVSMFSLGYVLALDSGDARAVTVVEGDRVSVARAARGMVESGHEHVDIATVTEWRTVGFHGVQEGEWSVREWLASLE